jgi:hypothetical protein
LKLNKERNLPIVHAREDLPDYVEFPEKFKEVTDEGLIKNKPVVEEPEPELVISEDLSETL